MTVALQPAIEPASTQSATARSYLAAGALVLLTIGVYWPSLANGFVLDDQRDVAGNLSLRSLAGLFDIWFKFGAVAQYYPLTFTAFWGEYHLWGLDPRGFHCVNLALHATAAVLVWRLLKRLEVPGAWLAAALFVVHPVEVESVAWIAELKNILSLVLALGSMLAYWRFAPPEEPKRSADEPHGHAWVYYVVSLLLYIAALLSKSAVASVPAVLLVILWWKRGRIAWRDVVPTIPFFAVGLVLAAVTVWVEATFVDGVGARGEEWDFSTWERVLIAGRAVWFYPAKLLWPQPLVFFYPRWNIDTRQMWQFMFPLTALLAIVGLWLARARWGRGPLAAVLIFVGVLLPGLGFFNVFMFRYSFVADHFQYHASIALFALASAAIANQLRRSANISRWLFPLAAVVLLVPLAVMAHQRTHVWYDYTSIWEDTSAKDPQSWVAFHSLGACYEQTGRFDDARTHFRKAIEIRQRRVQDRPTIAEYAEELAATHVDLGLLELKQQRPAEAAEEFTSAIAIRRRLVDDHPTSAPYRGNLAWSYVDLALAQSAQKQLAAAEASRRAVIAIRRKLVDDFPTNARFQDELAASLADLALLERDAGRAADAEQHFRAAIELRAGLVRKHPTIVDYQANLAASYDDLAIVLETSGRLAEALAARQDGIATRRTLAEEHRSISSYRDALAASYTDLGFVYRNMSELGAAQDAFSHAIAIRTELLREHPANSGFQDGLAWTYTHLAAAQERAGNQAGNLASIRAAIAIREKLVHEHPEDTVLRSNLEALQARALELEKSKTSGGQQ